VISRADTPPGFRDAQEGHAAYAIGRAAGQNGPDFPFCIALSARNEKHLRDLSALLTAKGIPHKLIEEPDAPWSGQATALCTMPMPKSKIYRYLSSLPRIR
jgi:hypothetical protein